MKILSYLFLKYRVKVTFFLGTLYYLNTEGFFLKGLNNSTKTTFIDFITFHNAASFRLPFLGHYQFLEYFFLLLILFSFLINLLPLTSWCNFQLKSYYEYNSFINFLTKNQKFSGFEQFLLFVLPRQLGLKLYKKDHPLHVEFLQSLPNCSVYHSDLLKTHTTSELQKSSYFCNFAFILFSFLIFYSYQLYYAIVYLGDVSVLGFQGDFVFDSFGTFIKLLIIFLTLIFFLVFYQDFTRNLQIGREVVFLLGFIVFLLLMLCQTTNFFYIVLLLEGISLCSYIILVSTKRPLITFENLFIYYLFNGLAFVLVLIGLICLGLPFLYQSLNFATVFAASPAFYENPAFELIQIGSLLFFAFLLFKLGAFPFHKWVPTLYISVPTYFLTFMSTVMKLGVLVVFLRFTLTVLLPLGLVSAGFFLFLGIINGGLAVLGSAKNREHIKPFFAYSSILQNSFVFFLVVSVAIEKTAIGYSLLMIVFFFALYSLFLIFFFGLVKYLNSRLTLPKSITRFLHLNMALKLVKSRLLTVLFYLALLTNLGLPPFYTFFFKYATLLSSLTVASDTMFLALAVFWIFYAFVTTLYYTRILKEVLFENVDNLHIPYLFKKARPSVDYLFLGFMVLLGSFILMFFAYFVFLAYNSSVFTALCRNIWTYDSIEFLAYRFTHQGSMPSYGLQHTQSALNFNFWYSLHCIFNLHNFNEMDVMVAKGHIPPEIISKLSGTAKK